MALSVRELHDLAHSAEVQSRLAAQLAREVSKPLLKVESIAKTAAIVVSEAYRARRALEGRKKAAKHYAAIREELKPFGTTVIAKGDVHSMVLGLRFASGKYRSPFDDIMHIV